MSTAALAPAPRFRMNCRRLFMICVGFIETTVASCDPRSFGLQSEWGNGTLYFSAAAVTSAHVPASTEMPCYSRSRRMRAAGSPGIPIPSNRGQVNVAGPGLSKPTPPRPSTAKPSELAIVARYRARSVFTPVRLFLGLWAYPCSSISAERSVSVYRNTLVA